MNKISEYFRESFGIIYNGLFYISLILIIAVIAFISGAIYSNYEIDNDIIIQMLPALGITLSALLASTSLMKSIQNTNEIEKKKKEKEEIQFKNKLKIYINEVIYILDLHKASKINEKEYNEKEYEYLSLLLLKPINHTKNLIINDANFLEKIEINEFNIIRYFNVIEIGLEEISKKYEKNLLDKINENFIGIIIEVKSINDTYKLELKLDKYEKYLN